MPSWQPPHGEQPKKEDQDGWLTVARYFSAFFYSYVVVGMLTAIVYGTTSVITRFIQIDITIALVVMIILTGMLWKRNRLTFLAEIALGIMLIIIGLDISAKVDFSIIFNPLFDFLEQRVIFTGPLIVLVGFLQWFVGVYRLITMIRGLNSKGDAPN